MNFQRQRESLSIPFYSNALSDRRHPPIIGQQIYTFCIIRRRTDRHDSKLRLYTSSAHFSLRRTDKDTHSYQIWRNAPQ